MVVASTLVPQDFLDLSRQTQALAEVKRVEAAGRVIRFPWDIIEALPDSLAEDWHGSDAAIESKLDQRVMLLDPERIHVGERCTVHPTAVLDGTRGSVYISHDVEIGAYAVVEGPAYVGPGSRINPHAWLHGGVALGPVCRVGGELDACILHGYSNKQHGGFLGHTYVGSWANLGAGCANSDLKNTYGHVRVPINGKPIDTGRTFLGAVIGDHAKIGINSSIPTGAVIGFSAMAAAGRILPKYMPSFGWFTDDGLRRGDPARMLDVASAVMARRDIHMTDDEVELFLELETHVAEVESGHPTRR